MRDVDILMIAAKNLVLDLIICISYLFRISILGFRAYASDRHMELITLDDVVLEEETGTLAQILNI